MDRKIGMAGSLINALTVLLFAIFLMTGFKLGYFFVCIILALSFICMVAALDSESKEGTKAAGRIGLVMAAIYSTLIIIVYYTQCTTVANENLTDEAQRLLDYSYMSIMFNLDILGYGIMALSTFFIGLTIDVKTKIDKALKVMLMLHGLFFPGCLIMPMTGMFIRNDGSSSSGGGGMLALEFWCAFFLPIGILAFMHFKNKQNKTPADL